VTVHLVYPAGPSIAAPHAIGRKLIEILGRKYEVRHHDWDDVSLVRPRHGDVLLGHAHPSPLTVFRASSRLPGWRRVLALGPYAHGNPAQMAFLDGCIRRCDLFLAITGGYWFRRIEKGPFAHWRPRMRHLDLAVDRSDFPRVKGEFHRAGERRFLYVGNHDPNKNPAYLTEIARRMPGTRFSFAGPGGPLAGLDHLGYQDFRNAEALRIVAEHDFLITVGRSDANPTTILEAMAWGLVPVCTRESGYEDEPGVVNVPLDDAEGAVAVLAGLEGASAEELERLRGLNDRRLESHFTWGRFGSDVESAIESEGREALGPESTRHRLWLAALAARAPSSPWRPENAWRLARHNLSRGRRP
jgi:glycosyltransferase involved in cell wall biosynthesis